MKKILFTASLFGLAFLAGSCQREALEPVAEGGVTYTISLPSDMQTKGDAGYAEYDLYYEVYKTVDADELASASILFENTVTMTGNSTTLELDLLNDQDYTVLFWANKKGGKYFDTSDLRNVGVVQAASNNKDRDAFCGMDRLTGHDAATGRAVTLKRPFAQLNIATLVPAGSYDIVPNASLVKVKDIPVAYNVATAQPVGETKEVEYTKNSIPTGDITVNGTVYKHVAMNYILVPESNVSVCYEIETNCGTVKNTIDNVPLKANYRTNIIGNLITSKADYEIAVDDEWGGSYAGPEFVQIPAYDEATKTWTITNADELRWVAASVNATLPTTKAAADTKNFKGETVVLANDIDLENELWTPIGTVLGERRYDYVFAGTFDGNYKTIRNLKVDHADCAGLFGNMSGATVRNVIIDGFDLNADHYAGAIVGWAEQGGANILVENCKALNGKIKVNVVETEDGRHDLGDKAGSVVGFAWRGTYKGNMASNVHITGYRDLGGIAGYGCASTVTDNKVENVTLSQDLEFDYKKDEEGETTPVTLGDYVGRNGTDTDGNACVIERNEGAVTKNTCYYVSDEETFRAAVKEQGAVVNIPENAEYTLPDEIAEGVTVQGASGSVLDFANRTVSGYKNVTFRNLTIKEDSDNYNGIQGSEKVNYENCVIEGVLWVYSTDTKFTDCTFKNAENVYNAWLYGGGKAVFTNCTFQNEHNRALLLYNEGEKVYDVTLNGCRFSANKQTSDKAAIQIHTEFGISGSLVIDDTTVAGYFDQSGRGTLWSEVANGEPEVASYKFDVIVDGVHVNRAGYTPVADYANLYTDANGVYCIFDKAGLADFHGYLHANTSRNPYGKTFKLMDDIDAEGWTWNSMWITPDSGVTPGYVFDGNNKTISNLKIEGEGMVSGGVAGMEYRNLTVDGVEVASVEHNAAIFVGAAYGSVSFDNVHVKNSKVNGLCNTGAFVGGTYEPNNLVVTFKICSVENTTIAAEGKDGQDPTGASGFLGKAYGATKVVFEGTNSIDNATTITNSNGLVGGRVYGYTTWYGDGFKGTGSCDAFTNWGGLSFVSTSEVLADALSNGSNVFLTEDVTTEAATTAPYGNKYAFKMDGGVLDGQGNELAMQCYGDDYGIMTSGGTVKNLTIKEGCRAIMIMYPTQDVVLENVMIGGDGVLYPINTGEKGADGVKLIVKDSELAGWTSYDFLESASFTNVDFKQGTYYNDIKGRVLKPYVNTTLTECSFIEHWNLDLSKLHEGHKVAFKNCYVNGTKVTADVLTVSPTVEQYDTELFTVDLPSWATSINDCVTFE